MNLKDKLNRAIKEIPQQALQIIEVEGLNFIKKNFQEQGFTDNSVEKWQPRKTTDRKGRDITRYRTNRVGKQGALNKLGRANHGRAILTGNKTGGDKLRNSFRAKRSNSAVTFYTYKPYAQRHNEGTDGMPQRQFIGKSKYLEEKIKQKIIKTLDNLLK